MKKRRKIHFTAIVVLILGMMATLAEAGDYPTRTITIINPYAPGGTLDIQARGFAMVAEKVLKQPVVVVNKAGATGMIGATEGAKAAPDGYTLTVGSTSTVLPVAWEVVNGRTPSVTIQDFVAIGSFTLSPTMVVVPYNSPWKTLADLIKDCKAKPGHYAICSGGLYGASHLPADVLTKATGIKVRHVPYKGGGPCLASLVGGHEDFATQYPSSSIPLARGNKLRVLAAQGNRRLKSIPEVPTVKELGIDAEYYFWLGVAAPKKTSGPLLQKLKEVVKKVAEDESFIKMIENQGDEVRYMGSEELVKYSERESAMHAKLYKQLLLEEKK